MRIVSARVGLTIAEIDEFATLEPISTDDNNQDPDLNMHENPIPDIVEQPNPLDPELDAELHADPELEPEREPDIFDNVRSMWVSMMRECICQYPQPIDEHTNNAQAANTFPPEPCGNTDANNITAAEGGVPLEAEINDADPLEVRVIHDPENPKIVKGGRWPDIVSFRKAIRHFAVKTGFEFADLVTDKTKFRARCKAEECPWRIHASRIFDGKTIEVFIFH